MGIPSDGSYGIPKDLIFSYPVTCKGGKYEIVQGLKISPVSQKMIDITTKELLEERDAVAHLLKWSWFYDNLNYCIIIALLL